MIVVRCPDEFIFSKKIIFCFVFTIFLTVNYFNHISTYCFLNTNIKKNNSHTIIYFHDHYILLEMRIPFYQLPYIGFLFPSCRIPQPVI